MLGFKLYEIQNLRMWTQNSDSFIQFGREFAGEKYSLAIVETFLSENHVSHDK